MRSFPIVPFLADQLRHVHVETAAAAVRQAIAQNYAQDDRAPLAAPSPLSIYQLFSREIHECAHAIAALKFGAKNIVVTIRNADATGSCCFDPIEKNADEVTIHLVGFVAETRIKPSAIKVYRDGCADFQAARLLIDKHNSSGVWPPLTCERAAQTACDFVGVHWESILGLAMVLGASGGRIGDAA